MSVTGGSGLSAFARSRAQVDNKSLGCSFRSRQNSRGAAMIGSPEGDGPQFAGKMILLGQLTKVRATTDYCVRPLSILSVALGVPRT